MKVKKIHFPTLIINYHKTHCLLVFPLAGGCPALEVQNATASAVWDMYQIGQPVTYTCDDVDGYFPGGSTAIDVTCMPDLQWDINIPVSGCDGM